MEISNMTLTIKVTETKLNSNPRD